MKEEQEKSGSIEPTVKYQRPVSAGSQQASRVYSAQKPNPQVNLVLAPQLS